LTCPSVLPSVMLTTSAPRSFANFAAGYLAYAFPCQRFGSALADVAA